jgi:hypothetical protein
VRIWGLALGGERCWLACLQGVHLLNGGEVDEANLVSFLKSYLFLALDWHYNRSNLVGE